MSRKNPEAAYTEITAPSPELIEDVYGKVYGPDTDDLAIEYHNLMHTDIIKFQALKPAAEAKKALRHKRREARRREEEERRLIEKRNDLGNLNACAAQIQKYVRGKPLQAQYHQLKESLADRPKKKVIIFIVDNYEDKRVRPTPFLTQDALEFGRVMQTFNCQVDIYSDACPDPTKKPTKANITAAIEEISKNDVETLTWVHVVGNGGVASVSGKNPFRLALKSDAERQTPRTRLINALQGSQQRSGKAVGDVCKYILPSDGKSSRLTFDTIVHIEECMAVLRNGTVQVQGRALNQRVLTVDVCCFGAVENGQGEGFAMLTSTASPEYSYTYQASTPENPDPHRSLLTAALLSALKGEGWSHNDEKPELRVKNLAIAVDAFMRKRDVKRETKGRSWGDIPLLTGERGELAVGNLRKSFSDVSISRNASLNQIQPERTSSSMPKRGPLQQQRYCAFRVTMSLVPDFAGQKTITTFSQEFVQCAHTFLNALSTPEKQIRKHELTMGRVDPVRTLCIGINGTFVDVAARYKARNVGTEQMNEGNVWEEAIEELTKLPAAEVAYTVCCGRGHEGSIVLCIDVTTPELMRGILSRISNIPTIFGGISHSHVEIHYRMDLFGSVTAFEQLVAIGRTYSLSAPQHMEHAKTVLMQAFQPQQPSPTSQTALQNALAPPPVPMPDMVRQFLSTLTTRIEECQPLLHRLNDMDDALMETLIRRERPPQALYHHTGIALCVMAMATPSAEAKAKQIAEMVKVMPSYDPFRGMRFLYWDMAEPLAHGKEKIGKLLDAIKANITSPAVIIMDLFKRRNIRMRLQNHTTSFTSHQITHFCDEFIRGALNDLLPPVKGSRVFGGGVASTKYQLIPV